MSTLALHIASECNLNPTIFAVALACAGEAALRAWHIGARGPDPRARRTRPIDAAPGERRARAPCYGAESHQPPAAVLLRQHFLYTTASAQRLSHKLQRGFTRRRRPRRAFCAD